MGDVELISADNPVFRAYAFYTAILAIKMLAMAYLTSRQRQAKKAFTNLEDVIFNTADRVMLGDRDVEKIRRAHRNDLQNIIPFFTIGFLYVLTDPSPMLAIPLFRMFASARGAHTVLFKVRCVKGFSFLGGLAILMYMALQVTMHHCT